MNEETRIFKRPVIYSRRMDRQALQHFRERLEQRRKELRDSIDGGKEGTAPVSPDNAIGRLTRVDAMQSQQMAAALIEKNRQELTRTERALARMASGDYGLCQRCGEEIPQARLQAIPDAVVCLTCAERAPRR